MLNSELILHGKRTCNKKLNELQNHGLAGLQLRSFLQIAFTVRLLRTRDIFDENVKSQNH